MSDPMIKVYNAVELRHYDGPTEWIGWIDNPIYPGARTAVYGNISDDSYLDPVNDSNWVYNVILCAEASQGNLSVFQVRESDIEWSDRA